MIIEIIGYSAGVLTLFNMLPQVVKSYRTKSVEDVSFPMVLIFVISVMLWTIYGFMINNLPLIITDFGGFVIGLVQIFLMLKYRKR